ncbi:hypothetical protein CEXT_615991 [Caerostris extrusa]|uniref:Uncharacterized protein n=1 Tax=Caerostris extrusa TaxID=172846 RepID=A0AAV4SJ43_CAEEX|nr:hypothetical protein CEXT_615991 [Caerostris extrusa]
MREKIDSGGEIKSWNEIRGRRGRKRKEREMKAGLLEAAGQRLKTENIKPLLSLCGTKQEKSYLGKKSLSDSGLVRIGGGKVPVQSRYRWIVLQMHDPELKGEGVDPAIIRDSNGGGSGDLLFRKTLFGRVRFRMDGWIEKSGGSGRKIVGD